MFILGIDTATAVTTVAITADAGQVLSHAEDRDARRHAEVLPGLARQVLADAGISPRDLGLVAAGVGPGPFTGLRVGVTFARATAQVLGIPVVGAMTLDVIARSELSGSAGSATAGLTVVTRSRRVEVAWAAYEGDGRRIDGPLILPDADYPRHGRVVGDVEGVDSVAYPSAAALCALVRSRLEAGEAIPQDRTWPEDAANGSGAPTARALATAAAEGRVLLPALPLYLRRPDAVPA